MNRHKQHAGVSRREFLGCSAAAAAWALTDAAAPLTAAEKDAAAATAAVRPMFHSRHIPIELLNLNTAMGKDAVRNGLCDATKPDVLKKMRDLGVELVEMRTVWWEFEPVAGRFAWDRLLRDMDAVQDAGLKVGLFAWLHHPPLWYDPEGKTHARLRAVGSNLQATVLSIWDPRTLAVYDRLLGVLADKFKERIGYIYNSVSGNYGEVTYELGAKHYKFSSPGTSNDLFLGDRCARASFAQELQRKYASVAVLNKAWGTNLTSFADDLMPKLPLAKNSLRHRDDCMLWATESLLEFADRACGLHAQHFAGVPGGLPLGFVQENLLIGQIKSRAAKLAAKHKLTARWTGCAFLGSFDRSHLLARRLASAAHFYGAPFGTEAALIINADNAANALYEDMANGTALIHDDPQNMLRSLPVQKKLRPLLVVDPPATPLAVYYPVENDMLQLEFDWRSLIDRCAELRRLLDFDVCDGAMIADGYLRDKRELLFAVNTHLRPETAQAVLDFAATRGRVWLCGAAEVKILHEPTTLAELAAKHGLELRAADDVGPHGLYRIAAWRQLLPHAAQAKFTIPDEGQPCFRTLHRQHESCYFPQQQRFVVRPRNASPAN